MDGVRWRGDDIREVEKIVGVLVLMNVSKNSNSEVIVVKSKCLETGHGLGVVGIENITVGSNFPLKKQNPYFTNGIYAPGN